MRFRADRDELAGAVAWAARALPARPAVPVLAGMVIDAGDALRLSCFDYEVSAQASIGYRPGDTGRALVPGRLLSDIVRSLPAGPLDLSGDAANVTVTGDGTTFTLPALPIEDHPLPPAPPPAAGTIDGAALAAAVARVAPAAGRDETLPMLTGVRLELTADTLTLDAVGAVRSPSVRLEFTAGAKRAIVIDGDYRCVLMPVRLAS